MQKRPAAYVKDNNSHPEQAGDEEAASTVAEDGECAERARSRCSYMTVWSNSKERADSTASETGKDTICISVSLTST